MKVSVVIPVYNAGKFIAESVHSALAQPETEEVVLVDDASTDNSYQVCQQLANENPKVKLYTHPGGKNQGSAQTRNLGIQKSTCPFIAFIDADDIFLPNRFALTKQIFEQHPDADGVYEAVENHFMDNAFSHSQTVQLHQVLDLHMTHKLVPPEQLLTQLIDDPTGIIMLQGLCVKRAIFDRSGLFDPAFRVFEDMLLVKKMAAVGRLYGGSLTQPVSQRRIHDSNISFSTYKDTNPTAFLEGKVLFSWAITHPVVAGSMGPIIRFYYRQYLYRNQKTFTDAKARLGWAKEAIGISAAVVFEREFWKIVPIAGRFVK